MKVKYKLHVPVQDFFCVIRDSIREELRIYGKIPETEPIQESVAYSKICKRGKHSSRTIVKIVRYEEEQCYQTKIKSSDGRVFELTYQFEVDAAGETELHYSEIAYVADGQPDMRLRTLLFGKISEHSMKRRFRKIEKAIQQQAKQG